MRRRHVSADPYWLTTRYAGECKGCGREIKRGERAFWYPNGRALYCGDDACGQQQYREFSAAAFDEDYARGAY